MPTFFGMCCRPEMEKWMNIQPSIFYTQFRVAGGLEPVPAAEMDEYEQMKWSSYHTTSKLFLIRRWNLVCELQNAFHSCKIFSFLAYGLVLNSSKFYNWWKFAVYRGKHLATMKWDTLVKLTQRALMVNSVQVTKWHFPYLSCLN